MRAQSTKLLCYLYLLLLARSMAEEQAMCGQNGPPIKFPFRLKGGESNGYPGFVLFCVGDRTALDLPGRRTPPNKHIFVDRIDYQTQRIYLYSPEKCRFGQRSVNWSTNISDTPFELINDQSFALFKCPLKHKLRSISAPKCESESESGFYVAGTPSDQYAFSNQLFDYVSCSRMYDIESGSYSFLELWVDDMASYSLHWSAPDCRRCEAGGKGCRLKGNSGDQTECFDLFMTRNRSKSYPFVIAGAVLGSIIVTLVIIVIFYVYNLNKNKKEDRKRIEKFLDDYKALNPSRYTYADVKKIANQFKEKLGEGAFGTVFKGKLSNDIFVAVKILNDTFKGNGEEFINEVSTMGQIYHVNVVRLVGFSADGPNRALVYDYLPNGSLEKYISLPPGEANRSLNWVTLQDIALGIAKGLEYLHQGCDQRILHFDIKPHNVLLDQDFTPKIADFGMAKLCSKDQSLVSMTTARGTLGYIAPEVFSRNFGNVSYKSDVYSFGILLLEMVGGRKNTTSGEENHSEHIYYPEWIYNLLDKGEDLRILVEDDGDTAIAKKLAIVGLWCIQWHPISRPAMKMAVQMLQGDEELTMPPNPFAASGPLETNSKLASRNLTQELETIAECE